jgi:hypothetical protein
MMMMIGSSADAAIDIATNGIAANIGTTITDLRMSAQSRQLIELNSSSDMAAAISSHSSTAAMMNSIHSLRV